MSTSRTSAEQTYKDTSWFTNLLLNADDQIYQTAALKHKASGNQTRWISATITFSIMLAIGVALGSVVSLVQQIRPAVSSQVQSLRESVSSLQAEVSNAATSNAALQSEVERLRVYVLPEGSTGLQDRYDASAEFGGFAKVAGSGMEITFIESTTAEGSDLVMDIDLIATINGLFAAGAKHVGVNGVAVTGTTSIRNAGSAVLVNYEPLRRPIRITAIGDSSLANNFQATDAQVWLNDLSFNYPIQVLVSNRERISIRNTTIPKITYAKRAEK